MTDVFQFLYRWPLESDLPVVLQVFWKLLTFSMVFLLGFEVIPHVQSLGGKIALSILATCFFVMGLFGKLGDG